MPFALNARTDAYLRGADRDRGELLAEAIARGRAFLDAGATCVFVPGRLERGEIEALVAGIGERRVSVLAGPGMPAGSELEAMGVARISFGPWTQRRADRAARRRRRPAGRRVAAGLGASGRLRAVTGRSRPGHGCYDGARHLSNTRGGAGQDSESM